jgi:hypothetical protein
MSDFEIDFVSSLAHKHLAVEISYQQQRLCIIDKEQGNDKLEIEFFSDLRILANEVIMKFPLFEFEAILKEASMDLKSCE